MNDNERELLIRTNLLFPDKRVWYNGKVRFRLSCHGFTAEYYYDADTETIMEKKDGYSEFNGTCEWLESLLGLPIKKENQRDYDISD